MNTTAWIDNVHVLTVIGNLTSLLQKNKYPVISLESQAKYFQATISEIINESTIKIRYYEELPIGEELYLLWGGKKIPIYPGAIVRTKWFDETYSNLDTRLGAFCDSFHTIFSIWAPTATSVQVILNNEHHPLLKQKRGIWQVTIDGDWHGYCYEYEIVVNGKINRVNDPYTKSLLPNSKKGIIVDFSRTKQIKNNEMQRTKQLQDTIIYELHVRDATIHKHSGVKHKGKFLGLTERNTTTPNGYSTGLSYIKELGVTHVQLLPINDFARVNELTPNTSYNWGYDPLFFQVPEGSYATSPEDPLSRINECKAMIEAFHEEGIAVILDVVYNHVFIMEESPFEKIVPGYYFRYHDDGTISNGTGVGNDIATERQMVRKFILDTVDFWLGEYKVDGFRFDLMGTMDTETMKQIVTRAKKESNPIMLLGEGWNLPTALSSNQKATNSNSAQLRGIRFFSDYFRDSLKGNLFSQEDVGFVNGDGQHLDRMPHVVSGAVLSEFGEPFVEEVTQTVNYVECHDNHTLWDRLQLTNDKEDKEIREKMHQLATGITLLSQGAPFIHAGQEWFRTKKGVENSYISNDGINQLDWDKREQEQKNITFIKSLIHLRKKYDVFRLTTKQEIRRRLHILDTPDPVFGFTLLGDEEDFSIYANPTKTKYSLHLPSSGKWKVAVSNESNKSGEEFVIGEYMFIEPYEFIVLQKSRKLTKRA